QLYSPGKTPQPVIVQEQSLLFRKVLEQRDLRDLYPGTYLVDKQVGERLLPDKFERMLQDLNFQPCGLLLADAHSGFVGWGEAAIYITNQNLLIRSEEHTSELQSRENLV